MENEPASSCHVIEGDVDDGRPIRLFMNRLKGAANRRGCRGWEVPSVIRKGLWDRPTEYSISCEFDRTGYGVLLIMGWSAFNRRLEVEPALGCSCGLIAVHISHMREH